MRFVFVSPAIILCLSWAAMAQQATKTMIITGNTTLPKDAVLKTPLEIRGSNLVLDGNGATVQGPGKAGDRGTFEGTGIVAKGCSNVTIRNLRVRGFRLGLEAQRGQGWCIEDCDFSDNYTNPDFGWGEEGRLGGIILTDLHHSVIRRTKARNNWNGLDLQNCADNIVERSDFSHSSNLCLRMWTASRNTILENNLSYGLRIRPGEKHARDSACVMIESGSNDNRFVANDITHGGDGVFIRALNDWVSTGNIFIENDCSYANNNCIECLAPRNVFIRNKCNHGSYGFWMGSGDQLVLIGNEAAYNGDPKGFHNAPEPFFGHAGITFVSGSSSHTLVQGNYCHDNNGPGIVLRGDLKNKGRDWRSYHWIIQQNRLENNRWGIYAQYADMVYVAANTHKDNAEKDFYDDVKHLKVVPDSAGDARAPQANLEGPEVVKAGQAVRFDASGSRDAAGRKLSFLWDLGGQEADGPKAQRTFDKPGFYRISVTVSNGLLADLAWRDLYVVDSDAELATDGQANHWTFQMDAGREGKVTFRDVKGIQGRTALEARVAPYAGGNVELFVPKPAGNGPWKLPNGGRLEFWVKYRCMGYSGFAGPNPIIRLYGRDGCMTYVSHTNLVGHNWAASEARWGWRFVSVDLAGQDNWTRRTEGTVSLDKIEKVGLQFRSWGQDPFMVWLDGMTLKPNSPK